MEPAEPRDQTDQTAVTASLPTQRQEGAVKRVLARLGGGVAAAAGEAREGLQEAAEAAGASLNRMHRRIALTVLLALGLLVLGAAFRAWGWREGNYALIALVGVGALYVVLSPVHVIGALLAGGGMAAWKGGDEAVRAMKGYARVLGVVLLAFLTPLFVFAMAPGDTGFWTSMRLVLLAPVVVLAMWLFGRLSPKVERWVLVIAPLLALILAFGNMLIPQQTLAAMGVPVWLRAERPQDAELARLETALETRRNQDRAERLLIIREKIEAGAPLTPQEEAEIVAAQRDRVTLTGWAGERYQAVLTDVRSRAAAIEAAARERETRATAAKPGLVSAPGKGWSAAITVPSGHVICTRSDQGERAYTTECALGDGDWTRRAAGGCKAGQYDRARLNGRGGAPTVNYRVVPASTGCD